MDKLAKHTQGEFWAQQQGTRFYLPDAIVGIADDGKEPVGISAAGMDATHVVQDTRPNPVGEHPKRGHGPNMDGCDACEKAYMQAAPARQGAQIRGNLNTANGDLLDFVYHDNNGNRYGFRHH